MKKIFLISVLLTIGVVLMFSANKEKTMSHAKSNLEIVKMIPDMYNGNPELADEIFNTYCIHHINGATEKRSGPEVVKISLAMIGEQFSDSQTIFNEIITDGDTVAVRWNWEAVNIQTQKKWKFNGNTIFHFREGKIVEYWAIDDRLREMLAHGFTLTPPQK